MSAPLPAMARPKQYRCLPISTTTYEGVPYHTLGAPVTFTFGDQPGDIHDIGDAWRQLINMGYSGAQSWEWLATNGKWYCL